MSANTKQLKHSHTISQAFVFLLLGVFAVFSTLMVLLGAQLYRGIVSETEQASTRRILRSYVTNAARGNDAADMIHVESMNGTDVLVFEWKDDEVKYQTMVYYYDGYLRELFTGVDQPFEPDYGEEICEAQAFEAAPDR